MLNLYFDFGLTDIALEWASSYLTDQTQYVYPSKFYSASAPVHSGVLQGSDLGPVPFSMYIKPLLNDTLSHTVHLSMTHSHNRLLSKTTSQKKI